MTLSEIVAELGELKGSGAWRRVAAASQIDYFTVSRIARGNIPNPGVLTCERIAEAIAVEKRAKSHGANSAPASQTL